MAFGVTCDRTTELQRDRNIRGGDFQAEIRRSWRLVPNVWRARITDGNSATRPADEITVTQEANLLTELKRTSKDAFYLSFLRAPQIKGLVDFDQVIRRNLGLVIVSFLTDEIDETYAFRLVSALKYMKYTGRASITLEALRTRAFHKRILIPRMLIEEDHGYDLKELVGKCNLL